LIQAAFELLSRFLRTPKNHPILPLANGLVRDRQPIFEARFSRRELMPFSRIRPQIVADGAIAGQLA